MGFGSLNMNTGKMSKQSHQEKLLLIFAICLTQFEYKSDKKTRTVIMSRDVGETYVCESCKAELVYTKGCPCGDRMAHSEICCGKQMTKVADK